MACFLGVLGCKNAHHRSAGSYALMVLAILGIALAVRVLLYAFARWLQRWQQRRAQQEEEETAVAAAAGGEAAVELQGGQSDVAYGSTWRQRYSRRKAQTKYEECCPANVYRHGHHATSS